MRLSGALCLIFACEPFMHPQEFLAFVHHADETAEAWVFGFEQGVEFAFASSSVLPVWEANFATMSSNNPQPIHKFARSNNWNGAETFEIEQVFISTHDEVNLFSNSGFEKFVIFGIGLDA